MFYHSLYSDWNHGNAHFLRGIVTEMLKTGDEVEVFEPRNNWSLQNMLKDAGDRFLGEFKSYYPELNSNFYTAEDLDLHATLHDADLVLVHEWNDPELVAAIGKYRHEHGHFRLLFHDTHHRSVTRSEAMAKYDLTHYDGVLAFGDVITDIYKKEGWCDKVWTWHEAADTNVFKPLEREYHGDLVWIGNWGDNERAEELEEFLIAPVRELRLKAKIYGVRYPEKALKKLEEAGIEYGGYLPNYEVPQVFSQYRMTVHVPRRPYVENLPGIPTIRPFEAMACGIPLISSPWRDSEGLFRPGEDFLMATNKQEMKEQMQRVLMAPPLSKSLSESGLERIQERHTCRHRLEQLKQICNTELGMAVEQKKLSLA